MYKTYIRSLFTLLITIMFALTIPALASAAPVGNPDMPGGLGKVSFGVGYDDSSTDLRFKDGRQTLSWPGGSYGTSFPMPGDNINDMKLDMRSKFIVGTVGLHEKVALFAGVGVNDAGVNYTLNYTGGHDNGEIANNSNTAWLAGIMAQFAEVAGVELGGMVKYAAFNMDGTHKINGTPFSSMFIEGASYTTSTKIHEWQAALTASKQMGRFSPYAGVTYRKVTVENKTDVHIPAMIEDVPLSLHIEANAEQEHTVGGVIGTGIKVWNNFDVNAEGRFGNEDAVTVSAIIRL